MINNILFLSLLLSINCCPKQHKTDHLNSGFIPKNYVLKWHDEFENKAKSGLPDTNLWYYNTGAHGWGNNELQNYIPAVLGSDTCALVSNGTLKIIAKKKGNQVISARINTTESWKYGYFEARLKLPKGKGTWPAFWMLSKDQKKWPLDGEIDIMEEVGFRPNYVSASVHCKTYNHVAGTQKTQELYVETAESEFHIYAVDWTEDHIRAFVDGKQYFEFLNDKKGDKLTWPFDVPFYLKLNLAWGGFWGGAQGVDESILPAIYEVDYVRVYQKK